MMSCGRLRYAVLILAVGCVILALSCGLGAVAVRQGVVRPPNLHMQLGGMWLVGIASRYTDCTLLRAVGCARLNHLPTTYIYTLWLFMPGDQQSENRPQITRLLAIQVGE